MGNTEHNLWKYPSPNAQNNNTGKTSGIVAWRRQVPKVTRKNELIAPLLTRGQGNSKRTKHFQVFMKVWVWIWRYVLTYYLMEKLWAMFLNGCKKSFPSRRTLTHMWEPVLQRKWIFLRKERFSDVCKVNFVRHQSIDSPQRNSIYTGCKQFEEKVTFSWRKFMLPTRCSRKLWNF
jgi:hypothetical protein